MFHYSHFVIFVSCIFKYFANAFTLFCYFVRVLRYIIVPFLAIVVEILHFCNFERPVGFNLSFNLQGPPSACFIKTSTLRIRCYVWKTFYISQIFTTYLLFTYYGYLKFATFTQVFQKISILKDEVFIKRAPDVLLKSQKWLECDIFIFSSPNFDCLFLVW